MRTCQSCHASLAGRRRNVKFCDKTCKNRFTNAKRGTTKHQSEPADLTYRPEVVTAAFNEWNAAWEAEPDYVDCMLDILQKPADIERFDLEEMPPLVLNIVRRLVTLSAPERLGLTNVLRANADMPSPDAIADSREENRKRDRILGRWDALPDDVREAAMADMLELCAGSKPRARHSAAVEAIFDAVRALKPETRAWLGPMAFVVREPDLQWEKRRPEALAAVVSAWHSIATEAPDLIGPLSRAATDPDARYSVDLRKLPKPAAELASHLFDLSPRMRLHFTQAVGLD